MAPLLAVSTSRTAPLFASVPPEITPPTISAPVPPTAIAGKPFRVTAPVPVFNGLLPRRAKTPFQFFALLPASVMAVPLILSGMPREMLSRPLPRAAELARLSRPLLSVVPPV